MNIQLNGLMKQMVNVQVDTLDFLQKLFLKQFNESSDTVFDTEVTDEGLFFLYDISMHGSPVYKRRLITSDKNQIEKFNALVTLIALFKSEQ